MTARRARKLLGVRASASPAELRAAWRQAAKAAHPDQGGDPVRFREVIEAYRLLREAPAHTIFPPRPSKSRPCGGDQDPVAVSGGKRGAVPGGRRAVGLSAACATATRSGRAAPGLPCSAARADACARRDLWMTERFPPRAGRGRARRMDNPLGRGSPGSAARPRMRGLVRLRPGLQRAATRQGSSSSHEAEAAPEVRPRQLRRSPPLGGVTGVG